MRDPAQAATRLPSTVEFATADFANPSSLTQAVEGVDAAFILTPYSPQQFELEKNVFDAVANAGVRRVV